MNKILKMFGYKEDDDIGMKISPDNFKLFVNNKLDIEIKNNGEFINYETNNTKRKAKVKIKDLTFADINECYYLAIIDSADQDIARETMDEYKKTGKINPNFVFKLDWEHIDPIAIQQNLDCWIERKKIFPNIEPLN